MSSGALYCILGFTKQPPRPIIRAVFLQPFHFLWKGPQTHLKRNCDTSKLGYKFIAGMLKHAQAIVAVTCPTVNSYKRLTVSGSMTGYTWAPAFASYGGNNRTNLLRVPLGGGRVECRGADIGMNPYLGTALALAAGLEGIRENADPGEPHMENVYEKSPGQRRREKIKELPRTLVEGIDAVKRDPLVEQVFGKAMFDSWVEFREQEWASYHNHVSDWERERYLKFW